MATVSFFCTRCRRLTTFPASRRGAIVYCPRCQQALIVPDIPTSGDGQNDENGRDEQDGASASTALFGEIGRCEDVALNGEEKEKNAGCAPSTRRPGATIASHLTPGKERPENWRRVEAGASNGGGGTNDEIDDASLLTRTEVSDAEFLRRLRSEPTTQTSVKPPVAPPVLWNVEETREDAGAWKIPKFLWGAIGGATLGSAFVVGAFWGGNAKNDDGVDATSVNRSVAKETVFVEGALTYRTANGTTAPDDGAFVFLFPTDERWNAPLALGDVSPQRPNPPGFEDVVAELETRGARFAVADFEGRFAFDDLEPGEYCVLLVSRRVGDDWGNANQTALKEIERRVVSPRLLLERNRFFWTTRRFDRDAATLEKSFGKAGAPFSNVD
ncbi:MAG: hypothetical protein J6K20_13040 [Thermoguttaceae bacterium]|nr:hypothetical protein [Thermoguttaceae bacterium]